MKKSSGKRRSRKVSAADNKLRTKRVVSKQLMINVIAEQAFKGDWDAIIDWIEPLLENDHSDHWLRLQLATAYHGKFDFDNALKHASLSLSIAPCCANTRWLIASIQLARGEFKKVIEIGQGLLNDSGSDIMRGPCGLGSDCDLHTALAESIINDSRMMMSIAYKETGYRTLSRFFLHTYKRHVAKGIGTSFPEIDEGFGESD